MFTGIVEELGSVVSLEPQEDAVRLRIRGPLVTSDAVHGASIAVNGVCLTVVEHGDDEFTADVMQETLTRSSLGALVQGLGKEGACFSIGAQLGLQGTHLGGAQLFIGVALAQLHQAKCIGGLHASAPP